MLGLSLVTDCPEFTAKYPNGLGVISNFLFYFSVAIHNCEIWVLIISSKVWHLRHITIFPPEWNLNTALKNKLINVILMVTENIQNQNHNLAMII